MFPQLLLVTITKLFIVVPGPYEEWESLRTTKGVATTIGWLYSPDHFYNKAKNTLAASDFGHTLDILDTFKEMKRLKVYIYFFCYLKKLS